MATCPKCGKPYSSKSTTKSYDLYIHREHKTSLGGIVFSVIDESCTVPRSQTP